MAYTAQWLARLSALFMIYSLQPGDWRHNVSSTQHLLSLHRIQHITVSLQVILQVIYINSDM